VSRHSASPVLNESEMTAKEEMTRIIGQRRQEDFKKIHPSLKKRKKEEIKAWNMKSLQCLNICINIKTITYINSLLSHSTNYPF
jgi:methyl coenzyme M reductase gamma subunit